MFSKFLITLAIVAGAAFFLRHSRASETRAAERPSTARPTESALSASEAGGHSELRFAAYLFLVLMLGLGSFLFYQDWRDDQTLITIKLYREDRAEPVIYEARKHAVGTRSFTTLDGLLVQVASDERMELVGF